MIGFLGIFGEMEMSKIIIRTAKEEDAKRLLEIYAPYVIDTAITFEYEVPTINEFRQRISNTLNKYGDFVVV